MSDIVERLRKGDQWAKPTDCRHDRCNCAIMDEAAVEIVALRSALSDARAEARRDALEEAANLIDGREWDTVIYEETTGDMLENVITAIRALSQQEKQS